MSAPISRFYEFGSFTIDVVKRVLLKDGEAAPLAPKAFDMLLVLVEHRGEVLEKDRLMEMLWPDSFVEEGNLTYNISLLRKALGESPNERRYIITVPGRGYRFAAEVREIEGQPAELRIERYAKSTLVVQEQETTETASTDEGKKLLPEATSYIRRWKSRLVILTAMGPIIVLAIYFWFSAEKEKPPPATKSLAVLPFKNLGAADDQYLGFELGIADSLITKLSNIREIKVRPTSSVIRYSAQDKEPTVIGRELGVEAVLTGTVRVVGEQVRVQVQLLRVKDGSSVWGDKFDKKLTDLLTVEDSITEKVAERLVTELTGQQRTALAKHYTDNVEAYLLYSRGLFFLSRLKPDAVEKSINYFQQAIEKDPNYVLAYSGLARAHATRTIQSDIPSGEALPKAREAASKALEIDNSLAEVHTALAYINFWGLDMLGWEREAKRAIELNPNHPMAHFLYAHYLSNMGLHSEAIAEINRALELDPISPSINHFAGQLLYQARRYGEAIEQLHKALDMDSTNWVARLKLGKAYAEKGIYDEAIAEIDKAREFSGGNSEPLGVMGYVYAVSGRKAESRKTLGELLERSKQRYVPPYNIATIYAGLGEKKQTLDWLDKAYEERDVHLTFLKIEPRWDDLRSEQRFKRLIERLGFPQ